MADMNRRVGGLRCGDLLSRLHDFVEGTLDAAEVDAVNTHLVGCDDCRSFGIGYGALVRQLGLDRSTHAPSEVRDRLRARMQNEWHNEEGRE